MKRTLMALAIAMFAMPAFADDKEDVMAKVNQFNDGLNKNDIPSAVAACASPASVLDEFPPYSWLGTTACADWVKDFGADSQKNGITEPFVTFDTVKHVDITGDKAYVVIAVTYSFKRNGTPESEPNSVMTFALVKQATGWAITGWTFSKG